MDTILEACLLINDTTQRLKAKTYITVFTFTQVHVYRKVHFIVTHPGFNSTTYEYDLALLWFHEPVKFSTNIIPICISEKELGTENIGWVTGWGQLYEGM